MPESCTFQPVSSQIKKRNSVKTFSENLSTGDIWHWRTLNTTLYYRKVVWPDIYTQKQYYPKFSMGGDGVSPMLSSSCFIHPRS